MFRTHFRIVMIFLVIAVSSQAIAKRFLFVQKTSQGSRLFHIEVFLEERVSQPVTRTVLGPLSQEWSEFRSEVVEQVNTGMRRWDASLEDQIDRASKREWLNPIDGEPINIGSSTIRRWFEGVETQVVKADSDLSGSSATRGKKEVSVFVYVGQNTRLLVRVQGVRAWVDNSSGHAERKSMIEVQLPGTEILRFAYSINPQIPPKHLPVLIPDINYRPIELFVVQEFPERLGIELFENPPLEQFFPYLKRQFRLLDSRESSGSNVNGNFSSFQVFYRRSEQKIIVVEIIGYEGNARIFYGEPHNLSEIKIGGISTYNLMGESASHKYTDRIYIDTAPFSLILPVEPESGTAKVFENPDRYIEDLIRVHVSDGIFRRLLLPNGSSRFIGNELSRLADRSSCGRLANRHPHAK